MRYSPARVGKNVADACWDLMDGVDQFALMKKGRTYLRENVFTPQAILRRIDMAGGVCNLKAYEIIRSVEILSTDPLKSSKRDSSILPHEKKIRDASMTLNAYAQKMLPMKHYNTPNGECIEYEHIVKFTITLFKAFGLDKKAARSVVDIALTLDGSSLTKNLQFVMAGIKLVDCAVRDPYTGKYDLKPIFGDKWFLPQSRKWCFPVKICMGKETEKMYQEEFKKIFELFDEASKQGQQVFPGWERLNFANPADMAAIQKCLGIGGAAKVMKFFCHCCSIESNDIVTPNASDKICSSCASKQESRPSWNCYHREFCSREQQKEYELALDELKKSWAQDMDKIDKKGVLSLMDSQYKKSIDYLPLTMDKSIEYMQRLVSEMNIRQRPTSGKTIHQMRAEVKECLIAERDMGHLIKQISQSETRVQAMTHIMKYVPCVMHCENRIGLKILTMLLEEGLSYAQGDEGGNFSDSEDTQRDTIKHREESYIKKAQDIVCDLLGAEEGSDVQWNLPVGKRKGESCRYIETINMENYRCRRVVASLDRLIDLSILNEQRKLKWKKAVSEYVAAMKIMQKKGEDYTPEELKTYQSHADEFFQIWVELHSRQGVTNYIHMVGSGHMYEYMKCWGNLTKYSQQGWEALNALIKLFFFRRSNKGGKNSAGQAGSKSKLIPIAKLLQRRFFWICNLVPQELWNGMLDLDVSSSNTDESEDDIIFDCPELV